MWGIARGAGFLLENLGVPIVFYFTFHAYGAKAAIAFATFFTLSQVVLQRALGRKLNPFFLTASFFTVCFGLIDLILESPRFFRLEPFAQNFLLGSVFAISAWKRFPLVEWFASGLPERFRPRIGADSQKYFRGLTWAWAAYFVSKSFLYLYFAYQVDLADLVALRSAVGSLSLLMMFLGELMVRKRFLKKEKARPTL